MKKGDKYLSRGERDEIFLLKENGVSVRKIAKDLGRSPSTILRELSRNQSRLGYYLPDTAQAGYQRRKARAGKRPLLKNKLVFNYVIEKLRMGWSPEQIAGRLPLDHPGEKTNYETIYQFIYSKKGKQLDLWEYLRYARKKRRKKRGRRVKRPRIPNRVSIELRPEVVEEREEAGHWEADSMVFSEKVGGLTTLVERKTRYVMISKVSRKTAEETRQQIIYRLTQLPRELRKTITCDNGLEFAQHERITRVTGALVYFCHAYASWEKGTNENTNGLIRQYLPRETRLKDITQQDLNEIAQELNRRPRKCLDYLTPEEVIKSEIINCCIS